MLFIQGIKALNQKVGLRVSHFALYGVVSRVSLALGTHLLQDDIICRRLSLSLGSMNVNVLRTVAMLFERPVLLFLSRISTIFS